MKYARKEGIICASDLKANDVLHVFTSANDSKFSAHS